MYCQILAVVSIVQTASDWRVAYGIARFACFLFPEGDEIASDITGSAPRAVSTMAWLALWVYTVMLLFLRIWKGRP